MNEIIIENRPVISVLVPFYNGVAHLEKCITGLKKLKYPNLRFIMVDDGSTDNSYELAVKLAGNDNRFAIMQKENVGVGEARNFLVDNAVGDYLFFVDVDDIPEPDSVDILYDLMGMYNADMVCGSYAFFAGEVKRLNALPNFVSRDKKEIHIFMETKGRNFCQSWGKLFKKKVFEGVRFPSNRFYEDLTIMPELIENVSCFVSTNQFVYQYKKNSDSITNSEAIDKQMDGLKGRMSNAAFYERMYPSIAPLAYDGALEFIFFLMGKINKDGRNKSRDAWKEIITTFKAIRSKAAKKGLRMKGAVLLTSVCPTFAAYLFNKVSS